MAEHAESLRKNLRDLKPQEPPAPWRRLGTFSVGGLTEIGFGPASDLLLVVSHDGRGLFDCRTGERIARDRSQLSNAWHDSTALIAEGIGGLSNQAIRIAGLSGGGLPNTTSDMWSVEIASPDWPDVMVILQPPGSSFLSSIKPEKCIRLEELGAGEFRAAGFSPTGMTLVIATSADIDILSRASQG